MINNITSYRKILLSAILIAFVSSLIFAGTLAFFSDEETSSGNTFTAGELDLTIDNTSYGFDYNDPSNEDPQGEWGPNEANSWELGNLDNCGPNEDQPCLFFNFADLKPGDYGEDTISLHVQNDAWACMAFDLTSTPENEINDPEEEAGDVTDGADGGELQNYLSFLFWNDDGDNVLEDDEQVIDSLEGLPGEIFTGDWLALAESGDEPLVAGETTYIGKGWCFGEITPNPEPDNGETTGGFPTADTTGFTCNGAGDHNDAQTDGIEVNVHFYSEQARNNDQFVCSGLPPIEEEPEREQVGAVLGSFAPLDLDDTTQCDETVGVGETHATIQAGVNAADSNETVCVADGTYVENVVIDVEGLTLSGDGASATSIIDGSVEITVDNVTVEGFQINGGAVSAPDVAGIYIVANTSGHTISDNLIDGDDTASSVGILFGYDVSNVLVTQNVIRDWDPGSYINPTTVGAIVFSYNDFESNTVGIGSDSITNVDINHNEFDGNAAEAIGISNAERDVTGITINTNNMIPGGGGGNDVNVYDGAAFAFTTTVDATDNWWDGDAEVDRTNDIVTVETEPTAAGLFSHN